MQKIRDRAVDAMLSVLATLFVLFGTGAWSLKENGADHRADIALLRAEIAAVRALEQRILDRLCDQTKTNVCTAPAPER